VLAWFEGRHAQVPPTLYTAKKPNKIAISDYRIEPPYESTPQETKQKLGVVGMETAPDFVDSKCLTRFTDKAINWLDNRLAARTDDAKSGKPFFLYVPYTSPHKPVIPLPEFRGKGQAGAYGEFMIETDHHIGRLLKFLDDSDLADDTLIVFTSDNGPENTWSKRKAKFNHASNHFYREGKRSIYEGGHRVPFFVRWPAGIAKPGRNFNECICQTDVLATLAELLGTDLPASVAEDSQSFLPVFSDEPIALRLPTIHHAVGGGFAIRDGNWKLIMPHGKTKQELYDLRSDPSETKNVLDAHADIARTLTEKITNIVQDGRTTPGEPQQNDTGHWKDLTWISK